jgi:uncharacterized surface protein with fasciclin (FAS1) repeats
MDFFLELLRQHVLPRVVCSSALKSTTRTSTSLQSRLVNVDRRHFNVTVIHNGSHDGAVRDTVYIGGAQLVEADLMATNGVIHIIDGVLFDESGALLQSKYLTFQAQLCSSLFHVCVARRVLPKK